MTHRMLPIYELEGAYNAPVSDKVHAEDGHWAGPSRTDLAVNYDTLIARIVALETSEADHETRIAALEP